ALFLVGAFLPPGPRLVVWLVALAVDVAAPRFDFRFPGLGSAPMSTWPTDAEHLAERNRLVFIIALGESILIMGFTLSEVEEVTAAAVLTTVLGFVGLFVLWWAYFALAGHDTAASRGEGSTAALRSAFAYAHALMVAGAIVVAVSIELRISHPETDAPLVLTTVGGPLIYLAGNVLFLRSRTGVVARDRYLAVAALVVIGIVGLALGHSLPALAVGVATLVVTTTLAVATQVRTTRARAAACTRRPDPAGSPPFHHVPEPPERFEPEIDRGELRDLLPGSFELGAVRRDHDLQAATAPPPRPTSSWRPTAPGRRSARAVSQATPRHTDTRTSPNSSARAAPRPPTGKGAVRPAQRGRPRPRVRRPARPARPGHRERYRDRSPRPRRLLTDDDGPYVDRPIFALPVPRTWEHDPTATLPGDAAHLVPPLGSASTSPLLDAGELALAIARHDTVDAAVRADEL